MQRLRLALNGAFKRDTSVAPAPPLTSRPTLVSTRHQTMSVVDVQTPLKRKRSSSMSNISSVLSKEVTLSRKLSRKISRTGELFVKMSSCSDHSVKNITSLAIAAQETDDTDTSVVSDVEEVIEGLTITERLHAACVKGKLNEMIEILDMYQEQNPTLCLDFNTQFLDTSCNGCTLMHRAAKYQRVEIMNYLYERGCSVDVKDVLHATPLFYAVSAGSVRSTSFLLSKNASVNIRDKFENSPAAAALKNGHLEVVRLLLLFNADIHYKVRQGQTLLHLAAESGDESHVAFLLSLGANPLRTNRQDENCLISCLKHPTLVKMMCERTSSGDFMKLLRMTSMSGYTAFHVCAQNGYLMSLMWLIQYIPLTYRKQLREMINDSERTLNHNTPLHLAVLAGHKDIVSYLLKTLGKEIQFEKQNALGDTVLHSAIRECNGPMFSLLKRASEGRCNKIKNSTKMTPKQLARDLKVMDCYTYKEEVTNAKPSASLKLVSRTQRNM
jgi:ankyrin repeat protein